ncbi:MAG TPA: ATP-binding cassette domain-containing protein [Ilumatobacteraceae bacterium]
MAEAGTLRVDDLVMEYVHDGYAVRPLDGLSFEVPPGELAVLLGPSGSGKTTLLSCLGGILTPTSGSIRVGDTEVSALRGGELEEFRRTNVGFVFQAFNLIPSLTARENVAVPLVMTGTNRHAAFERADALLNQVGLAQRASHKPARLSGGQQQRVAIARGLGQDPPLLLADEPTANLDHIQAEAVIRLLRDLRDQGRVVVVSTHDARLVPIADRIVQMVPEHEGAAHPHEVRVAAGTSIFEQGDASDVVYTIEAGEVDIVRVLADGTEERLNTLGPGQYFGELGAFLGFPRSASARAKTDAVLNTYEPHVFKQQIQPDR